MVNDRHWGVDDFGPVRPALGVPCCPVARPDLQDIDRAKEEFDRMTKDAPGRPGTHDDHVRSTDETMKLSMILL